MRWGAAVLVCALAGCQFDPSVSSGDEGNADPSDAAPGSADAAGDPVGPVPHVPPAGSFSGSADLSLSAEVIDTTDLTIDGAAPGAGIVFDAWPQDPSGPELAVLHVRSLTVTSGGTVRVTGSRPLVVIASGAVSIDGIVSAQARGPDPGPGGFGASLGPGAGFAGEHVSGFVDSGGGGASFGSSGERGGDANCVSSCSAAGGLEGAIYGDSSITVLEGGSGGGIGASGACGDAPAGAGGGAIQLYSATAVTVSGGINAGGGGGTGGIVCYPTATNLPAGSGGGSGGAIFLVAPSVQVDGRVDANGGGGGAGAGSTGPDDPCCYTDGANGQDGRLADARATGGPSVGNWSGAGGAGATATLSAEPGSPGGIDGNGGSGGGGAGRIVVLEQ